MGRARLFAVAPVEGRAAPGAPPSGSSDRYSVKWVASVTTGPSDIAPLSS